MTMTKQFGELAPSQTLFGDKKYTNEAPAPKFVSEGEISRAWAAVDDYKAQLTAVMNALDVPALDEHKEPTDKIAFLLGQAEIVRHLLLQWVLLRKAAELGEAVLQVPERSSLHHGIGDSWWLDTPDARGVLAFATPQEALRRQDPQPAAEEATTEPAQ